MPVGNLHPAHKNPQSRTPPLYVKLTKHDFPTAVSPNSTSLKWQTRCPAAAMTRINYVDPGCGKFRISDLSKSGACYAIRNNATPRVHYAVTKGRLRESPEQRRHLPPPLRNLFSYSCSLGHESKWTNEISRTKLVGLRKLMNP